MTTSGGYVLASDNKGACSKLQTPQTKSATGTGTLTFSAYGIYTRIYKLFTVVSSQGNRVQNELDIGIVCDCPFLYARH